MKTWADEFGMSRGAETRQFDARRIGGETCQSSNKEIEKQGPSSKTMDKTKTKFKLFLPQLTWFR